MTKFTICTLQFSLLLACFFFFHSCEKDKGTVVRINQQEFAPEEQQTIGDAIDGAAKAEMLPFPSLSGPEYDELYDYLNTHLRTISNTQWIENRLNYNWQARVLKADTAMHAFAGPGGYFYITSGMLKAIDSEHELLAAMAHEIIYMDKGLTIKALKDKFGGDGLADILLGNHVPNLGQMADWLARINYTGADVLIADSLSVQIICPFSYNAFGLQSLLERLEGFHNDPPVHWLAGRLADSELRITKIVDFASDCGDGEPGFQTRYQDFRALLP